MTMTDLCLEVRNFFPAHSHGFESGEDIHSGTYTISSGSITPLPELLSGQYFRIVGSILNDGVYKNTAEGLTGLKDETFTGEIWSMAVPIEVQALVGRISEWETKHGEALKSPYMSESFGGYSYTKSNANSQNVADMTTWQGAFKAELRPYRRLRVI